MTSSNKYLRRGIYHPDVRPGVVGKGRRRGGDLVHLERGR